MARYEIIGAPPQDQDQVELFAPAGEDPSPRFELVNPVGEAVSAGASGVAGEYGTRLLRRLEESVDMFKRGATAPLRAFTETDVKPEDWAISPGDTLVKELGRVGMRGLESLGIVGGPIQALTSPFIDVPVEMAARGMGAGEETSRLAGDIGGAIAPLGYGLMAKAGKLAKLPGTAGIVLNELMGAPRDIGMDPTLPARAAAQVPEARNPHFARLAAFREAYGRNPSGKEMQAFKDLTPEQIKMRAYDQGVETLMNTGEAMGLEQRLAADDAVSPTRALARATELGHEADIVNAVGNPNLATRLRQEAEEMLQKESARWYNRSQPGAGTMSGFVAGSYSGFEEDEEGNVLFNPAKAILGTALAGAGVAAYAKRDVLNAKLKGFTQFVKDWNVGRKLQTREYRDLNSGVIRQIGLPEIMSNYYPEMKPAHRAALAYDEQRHFTEAQAQAMLGGLLKKIPDKVKKSLFGGSATNHEWTDAELQTVWHLDPAEILQHRKVRETMDFMAEEFGRSLQRRGYTPAEAAAAVAQMKKPGFVPLSRWGDYGITVRNADDSIAYFTMQEGKAAHNAAKGEVSRSLAPGQYMEAGEMKHQPAAFLKGLDIGVVSVLKEVDDEVRTLLAGMPTPGSVISLQARMADILKGGKGFPSHLQHQIGTPGYTMDLERGLAEYVRSLSQYISRAEAKPKFMEAHKVATAAGKGQLADYISRYGDQVLNPTGDYGTLREMAGLYYLGAKAGSALVNLSGYLTMGLPIMSRHTKRAEAIWAKAAARAFGDRAKLPPEWANGLRVAEMEGVVGQEATNELLGRASGRPEYMREISDAMAWMFGKAEIYMRRASYLAGREIADARGLPREAAHEFAKDLVREINLNYNKSGRPELLRTGLGSLFGTFRLFPLNWMSKIKEAARNGEMGPLTKHLAVLGVVAGAAGIPGAKLLIEGGRKLGYDLPTWVREKGGRIGETALYGFPYTSGQFVGDPDTGIDMSGSAGFGDILPSELVTDPMVGLEKAVMGVTADPLNRGLRSASLFAQGKGWEGTEALLPEALRALSTGGRAISTDTFSTTFGEPMVKNPGMFEILVKSLGLQPSRLSRAYTREAAEKQLRQESTKYQEVYYRLIAQAIRSQDQETLSAVLQDIYQYNQTHPRHMQIEYGTKQAQNAIRRHIVALTMPEVAERQTMPRRALARYQQIQEAYK